MAPDKSITIRAHALLAVGLWTVALVASLAWNVSSLGREAVELAVREAREHLTLDRAIRTWAAQSGRVYLRVGDGVSPNPNLAHLPGRDLQVGDGATLTLVSPDTIMRQISAIHSLDADDTHGSLKSMGSAHPEYLPDEWETGALGILEGDTQEYFEVVGGAGSESLRFMIALETSEHCKLCHNGFSYSYSSGLSITLPLAGFHELTRSKMGLIVASHAGIWMLGLLGIAVGLGRIADNLKSLTDVGRDLTENNQLLEAISRAQSEYISDVPPGVLFDNILERMKLLTGSGYGFIGEVLHAEDGAPYLKTYAMTNIAWSDDVGRPQDGNEVSGMELHNLDSILGAVVKTEEPVISNDPANDSRRGGMPEGHPPLMSFLGLPFNIGGRLMGMAGLANREGGYDEAIIQRLAPLCMTTAHLIEGYRGKALRRQAEEDLDRNREFLQSIIDGVADPLMVIRTDYGIMLMNKAAGEISGNHAAPPLGGRTCFNVSHRRHEPCSGDDHPCPLKIVLETRAPVTVMHEHYAEDGSKRYYEIVASPLLARDGSIEGVIEAGRDVTERVMAERALIESEQKYRRIMESANDAIFVAEIPSGIIVDCNRRAAHMLGLKEHEIIGMNQRELFPEEDVTDGRELFGMTVYDSRNMVHDRRVRCRSGADVWVDISSSVFETGGRRYMQGIFRDITERRKIEESLKEAVHEREMLVKEVYHRVKNNLLTVGSLLRLQGAQIQDTVAAELFAETQNRVKAMSMIHERLYRSGDLKSIDLNDYVRSIAVQLFRTYKVTEAKVRLRTEIEPFELSVDQMIPCGLVLNELVTNSLRHAFAGDRKGELHITFLGAYGDSGKRLLSVRDTGAGLPQGFRLEETTSLGLKLVESLSRQLGGVLTIESGEGGTEFRIVF